MTIDELPFLDGHESPATVNGAKGARPCRRHSWRESPFEGEGVVCWKCGKPKDATASRRSRNNGKRGRRAELDVARSICGGRKMGPLGLPWDVEVGTYARLQVKKLARRPGPAEISRLIMRIPDTGDRLRGFVWVEAAGQGKHGARVVWFHAGEFAEWHGDWLLALADGNGPDSIGYEAKQTLVRIDLAEWAEWYVSIPDPEYDR